MANEQYQLGYGAARNVARMNAARPAAWPTGVSLLAQMVDACQRCDATDDCDDRMARAPTSSFRDGPKGRARNP